MRDILSSLWSGVADFVGAWLMPSFLSMAYVFEILLPNTQPAFVPARVQDLEGGARLFAIAAAALALALVLASAATPLTRVLEGYYLWPPKLKDWRIKRHKKRQQELRAAISSSTSRVDMMRYRERLNGYPRVGWLVLPTRLGNALRAGESYGWVQYGFSVPDLWTHLTAVASSELRRQLRQSRTVLDLFIAATWLSAALAVVTLATLVSDYSPQFLAWAVVLAALVPFWYHRAVGSVAWYARSMWALADLCRTDLADRLGLQLPGTLEEERKLWRAVSEYAAWGRGWTKTPEWISQIDEALTVRGAGSDGSQQDRFTRTPRAPERN